MWQEVRDLASAIENDLDLQGLWVERVIVIEAALDAARSGGAKQAQGVWLGNLGLAYANLGRVEEAIDHYQQALVISREIGDRRSEGAWLGSLGNAYRNLGRVEEAIGHYQQGIEIFEEIKSPNAETVRRWLAALSPDP